MNPMSPEMSVRLERTIAAAPAAVYRAWLQPDVLRRWLAPGDVQITLIEVEERVGGRYRVRFADAGSAVGGFECELLELVPDQRIVFRWGFAGPAGTDGPVFDSKLTIGLREAPDGATTLTLVHEHLETLDAAMPDVAKNVSSGWQLVLDKLGTTIAVLTR